MYTFVHAKFYDAFVRYMCHAFSHLCSHITIAAEFSVAQNKDTDVLNHEVTSSNTKW